MRHRAIRIGMTAALAVAAHAGTAGADADAARAAFERGIELFDAGDPAGALTAFEHSYALRALPTVLLNIAVCLEQLGRFAEALRTFRMFVSVHGLEAADEDLDYVRVRIRELSGLQEDPRGDTHTPPPPPADPDRVRVEISTDVPDAEIRVGGELVGRGGVAGYVLPGRYEVVAMAPGYRTRREEIVVEPGRPVLQPMRLRRLSAAAQTTLVFEGSAGWVKLRVTGGGSQDVLSCLSPCTMVADDGLYDLVDESGTRLGGIDAQGGTQVWRLSPDSLGCLIGGIVSTVAGLTLLGVGVALIGGRGGETDTELGTGLVAAGVVGTTIGIPLAALWRGGATWQYTMDDAAPTAALYPQLFPAELPSGRTAYGLGLRVVF
jgi:hypothetical protein